MRFKWIFRNHLIRSDKFSAKLAADNIKENVIRWLARIFRVLLTNLHNFGGRLVVN